ncbi:MAG: DUF4115 domain-containing protein [Gammaproteobacteria bacterium]|nr:DUF4115 domain-containing protein [Gammaproteobacteria bacterium]MBU6510221.1 DUF4115 domain-containing protein [Gammaproteobacteria bacterium]MDE2108797.1 helix-turn-helix domain-containing protein [Gammaproteobacteria bacterium]
MAPAPVDPAIRDGSLGGELRAAREARHLALHKVAQEMHVGDDIIQQLEQDDYAALGAPIFVHGHLRNYARLLGLDPDEVLAKYDQAAGRLAPPPLVTQQSDPMGRFTRRVGLPAFSGVVIIVLLVLAVVWWRHRAPTPELSASVQLGTTAPVQPSQAAVSAGPAAGVPLSAPENAEVQSTLPTETAQPPRLVQPETSAPVVAHRQTVPVPPQHAVKAGATQVYSLTEKGVAPSLLVHAKFSVHQASWIEVYDAAGKRLYYSEAPSGADVEISGAGPLQVFLGNAPGVSVEYNGTAFNAAPFIRPDNNTARFTLGGSAGSGKPGT